MTVESVLCDLADAPQVNYLVGQVLRREPRANPHVVRRLVVEKLIVAALTEEET
jgi:hypothetical protein